VSFSIHAHSGTKNTFTLDICYARIADDVFVHSDCRIAFLFIKFERFSTFVQHILFFDLRDTPNGQRHNFTLWEITPSRNNSIRSMGNYCFCIFVQFEAPNADSTVERVSLSIMIMFQEVIAATSFQKLRRRVTEYSLANRTGRYVNSCRGQVRWPRTSICDGCRRGIPRSKNNSYVEGSSRVIMLRRSRSDFEKGVWGLGLWWEKTSPRISGLRPSPTFPYSRERFSLSTILGSVQIDEFSALQLCGTGLSCLLLPCCTKKKYLHDKRSGKRDWM